MSSKACSGCMSSIYQWATGKHLPFEECCIVHDDDYSEESVITRKFADAKLAWCVAQSGYPITAKVMHISVRLFGWMFYAR